MQPGELESALADPKVLKQTIAKAKVADAVEGKKVEELSPKLREELSKSYKIYKRDGKQILEQRDGQGLNLHVDKDGVIQSGSANNVNPWRVSTDKMKQEIRADGVEVKDGQPIHHLETIESVEKAPLIGGSVKLEKFPINQGKNLTQLPKDSASRKLWPKEVRDLLPEHGPDNYHPKWRKHVIEVANKKLESLRKDYGISKDVSDDEAINIIHQKHPGALKEASEELLPILKNDLLVPKADWIKLNENGERVLAFNQSDNQKDNGKSSDQKSLNA
jgi:hypothetical protein